MSNGILNAAFDAKKQRPRDRLVLLALADRANEEGICWPAVADIRRRTGLCERAVQMAVSSLQKEGHITVESGHTGGRTSRTYRVHPVPDSEPVGPIPEKEARRQRMNAKTPSMTSGPDGMTGATVTPLPVDGCNHDTPPPHAMHPSGAGDALHGRTPCTQTIREQKKESPVNPQRAHTGFSSVTSQKWRKNKGGPAPLADVLAFCRAEGIPESDGETCFYEWEGNGWCAGDDRIRDWQAVLKMRWEKGWLHSQEGGGDSGAGRGSEKKWRAPRPFRNRNGSGGRFLETDSTASLTASGTIKALICKENSSSCG